MSAMTGRKISTSLTGKHALTDDEDKGVAKLKDTFKDVDSGTLLRFFRASKGKIAEATKKIVQHIEWRQSTFPIKYDEVRSDWIQGKYVLCGRDKEGDLIVYIRVSSGGFYGFS